MPSTKRFMNWSNVAFTPQGGTPTPISGVQSVEIDSGGHLLKFSGDGDRYPTTIVHDLSEPTVTVHASDLAAIQAHPVGTVGTLTATHNDARNGSGVGSITYTMTNAVIAGNPVRGAHRQFGLGTLTLTAFSSDGVTNPLSITVAS